MPVPILAIPRGRRVIAEDYATLLREGNLLHVPTNAAWTQAVVGSGASAQEAGRLYVNTGATANSSALLRTTLAGFGTAGAGLVIDWTKKLILVFHVERDPTDTQVVARVQLKEITSIGALGERGIGLRSDNYALVGESYGTALGTVDLGVSLTDSVFTQIAIVHEPAVPRIEWYTAESGLLVLRGTQSTAANMPSVAGTVNAVFILSILRGATGTVDSYANLAQPKIWQAR